MNNAIKFCLSFVIFASLSDIHASAAGAATAAQKASASAAKDVKPITRSALATAGAQMVKTTEKSLHLATAQPSAAALPTLPVNPYPHAASLINLLFKVDRVVNDPKIQALTQKPPIPKAQSHILRSALAHFPKLSQTKAHRLLAVYNDWLDPNPEKADNTDELVKTVIEGDPLFVLKAELLAADPSLKEAYEAIEQAAKLAAPQTAAAPAQAATATAPLTVAQAAAEYKAAREATLSAYDSFDAARNRLRATVAANPHDPDAKNPLRLGPVRSFSMGLDMNL
jgi:hypothetical protein